MLHKKQRLAVLMLGALAAGSVQAVDNATRIYTDGDFFSKDASGDNNNPTSDVLATDNANVLGFRWDGTDFSTGVNNSLLTDNSVTFENTRFRALQMTNAPTDENNDFNDYFAAVPSDQDPPQDEFENASSGDITALITGGERGLDFVSGIFNLPPGVVSNFSFGGSIDPARVDDGVPDLIFAKLGGNIGSANAQLIDDADSPVGSAVNLNPNGDAGNFVGQVLLDFLAIGTVRTEGFDGTRAVTLFLVELSEFGTASEIASAADLEITWPGGLDFVFVAGNENSIPTASSFSTTQNPTDCSANGNGKFFLTPPPQVQTVDANGNNVQQPGITVRAKDAKTSDGVDFSGKTEETTNDDGIATFDELLVDNCPNDKSLLRTTYEIDAPGLDASTIKANDDEETVQKDSGTTNLAVVDNDDFGPNGPAATAIEIPGGSDTGNGTATVDNNGTSNNPTDDTIDYTPDGGFFGTDSFDYRIEDSTGTTSTATVTITVNDPPAITLPGTPTFDEDSSGNPIDTSMDISDGDGDNQTVTLTASNGTFNVVTTTGLTLNSGSYNSASVDFSGTLGDVNNALDGLTFTPTADFDGSASIQVQTDDGNGAIDDQTLNITVNDAPEVSSINRGSTPVSNPTNADTVEFDVTFSETVSGVDAADFDISSTGSASTDNGNSDISVTGSGNSYTVAVANITGEGTITVNLADDDSIVSNDGNNTPLGGVGISANGDGSRSGDQVFAVDRIAPSFTSAASTNFAENGMGIVLDIDADDGIGADNNVTYSLTGGTDQVDFSINGSNGQLTFNSTPPDFENPTDSDTNNDYVVDVSATDGLGNMAVQTVTVNVTNVNENPVFTSATSASFAENDTGTVIDVNATDGDGGANDANVTYSLTGGVDDSLFSINTSNGAVTFNSSPDFETPTDNGTDNVYNIQVQADDSTNQATQAIAITVTDVNEAPTDITLSNNQVDQSDGSNAVVGTLDATDPDTGDTHTFSLVSGAGDGDNGSFNISGTDLRANDAGSLPAGTYNIRLEADDGNGGTFEKAFTVTVNDDVGPNAPNPPDLLAVDDSGASDSDDVTNVTDPTLRVDLSGTNAEAGDTVEVLLGGAPLGTPATATLASGDITNGNVDIAITDGDLGTDGAKFLTARVTDTAGNVGAESAALSLILDTSAPSLDTNSGLTVDEDASATPITNTLLASSDNQSGAASITYTVSSGPSDGSLSPASFTQQDLDNDNVTYKPDDDFAGNDSVTLDIMDAAANTLSGQTFTITINAVNDAPQVNNDTATTDEDMPVTIDVLANDSDIDGNLDPATAQVVSGPENGATTVNASNGEITYSPDANFNGSDTFDYEVCDDGTPVPPKCSQAMVTISVGSVNDLPSASDDALTVVAGNTATADVLANDDFGGDGPGTGAITIGTAPSDGMASVDDGGTPGDPTDDRIAYTPDSDFAGSDSLVYAITDANGDTATATLAITVESADAGAPAASDDVLTVAADNTATADVLANDTFGSDGPGTGAIEITTAPSDGTASVDDGGTPDDPTDDRIDYTPDAGFAGSDSLVYRIADADGDTAEATVSVTVNDTASGSPAAGDDVADVDEDDSVVIAVLANDDFGGDGAGTTAAEISGRADNGTATVNDGGTPSDPTDDTVAYEPADGFFGTDAFDYRITDADGDTARATVQVSVEPVNDAPAITLSGDQLSDSGSGEQVVSNFAANFEPGPDESEQSIAEFIVSNDDNALFAAQPAIATDGTLSYTPNDANLEGIAEVTVQVRDDGTTDNGGQDLSQPQTFTISIGVSADVEISVTGPANAAAGSEVTYTVNVTNNGPSQAEGVVVSVDVPDSVTFVSAEPPCSSGFPCSIGGLTASSPVAAGGSLKQPGLQAIDVGQVVEFDATFRLGSSLGGNEQLSWNITSDSGDPNPGNDDDQSILGVAALPVPVLGRTGLLLLCLMLALAAIVATRRCSIQVG